MMAQEDVAVVCALVLLLRLGRFPEPDGFAELRPLSVFTLWMPTFLVCALMSRTLFKGLLLKPRYRSREVG